MFVCVCVGMFKFKTTLTLPTILAINRVLLLLFATEQPQKEAKIKIHYIFSS